MRTDDGSIIYECLNGEPEAFGVLVDRYKEGIYAYVYAKLRDFHDAQDVTQEVFLQAYRGLRSLRRWESFSFWLYRIASARCKLWIRTQLRRVDQDFIADHDPETLENLSIDSYRVNQLSEFVQEALDLLPETYREALILYYFGGMNSVDIARALGTSPNAIRHRLSRARAQMKEEMVAMMGTAFEGQGLPAGFTFRLVEAVKHINIHPMPRTAGLPWGLSLAAGIVFTVMSLNPHLNISDLGSFSVSSALPNDVNALKTGEIAVDILETSQISMLSGNQGDGNNGFPSPQHALLMAPQAKGDTWTKKAGMPTARFLLSTSMVDGKIYAIGGARTASISYSIVEEYDPVTDTWTGKADMPTARSALSTSVVDGKIYAIGGTRSSGGPAFSTVEEYDPATDTWTRKSDMPTARGMVTTSVVNGKIYAIGGARSTSGPTLSTVEEYDPETDTWTRKADLPEPRYYHSAGAVNGRIYIIAGSPKEWASSPAVYEYDPVTDTWTRKADISVPTAWHSASVVNGKIYAIGGDPPVMEEYDPVTDTWTKKADMLTTRVGLSTSAVNGKIYAIGGSRTLATIQSPVPTVEEYDTGFVPPEESASVGPSSKLSRTWGETKLDW